MIICKAVGPLFISLLLASQAIAAPPTTETTMTLESGTKRGLKGYGEIF
jgi:hypothetical protein